MMKSEYYIKFPREFCVTDYLQGPLLLDEVTLDMSPNLRPPFAHLHPPAPPGPGSAVQGCAPWCLIHVLLSLLPAVLAEIWWENLSKEKRSHFEILQQRECHAENWLQGPRKSREADRGWWEISEEQQQEATRSLKLQDRRGGVPRPQGEADSGAINEMQGNIPSPLSQNPCKWDQASVGFFYNSPGGSSAQPGLRTTALKHLVTMCIPTIASARTGQMWGEEILTHHCSRSRRRNQR